MTDKPGPDTEKLNANLEKLNRLTKKLALAMADREPHDNRLDGPNQELYAKAAAAYMSEMMSDPARLIQTQVNYWSESLRNFAEIQQQQTEDASDGEKSTDRRFQNDLWQSNPYFNLVKKQYLLSSEAIESVTSRLQHLPGKEREQINFFTKQFLDLMSPSNFLASNPDALEKAIATDGQSLVDGLENFVSDLEANKEGLAVTLSDPNAFAVGENIATTKGGVVFQNRMFQLIQYAATTDKVHKAPLVIFPPWINKFYILDLKPQNSLIKFMVDKGHTVFVVSWVNPDGSYRDTGFDTYLEEGLLTALNVVRKITRVKKVNAVGYCIAGTLLTSGLAYLAQTGQNIVNKATFFTTMTDFEEPGELGTYIDENFVSGISEEVMRKGVLGGFFMSRAFSFLRANDLVYAPAIRSYMLGEAPPAFDLLHWNSDSTNMPARMSIEYLTQLYQQNALAKGEFELLGQKLDMANITTPIFAVATISDHIAPWKASFNGLSRISGDKTFVLSESGHIAGVVNPASRNKYGHWVNPSAYIDADSWLQGASFEKLSWWNRWDAWLAAGEFPNRSARKLGSKAYPVLEDAPGSYVNVSYK